MLLEISLFSIKPILQEKIEFTYYSNFIVDKKKYREVFKGFILKTGETELHTCFKIPIFSQDYISNTIDSYIEENKEENFVLALTNIEKENRVVSIIVLVHERFSRTHIVEQNSNKANELLNKVIYRDSLI